MNILFNVEIICYFKICFFACLPACILKQLVNVVQLTSAAEAIAQIDADEYKGN